MFVGDNLSFTSELLIRRKHTRFGMDRFAQAISSATAKLQQFQQDETARIVRFQQTILTNERSEAVLLRCFEQGVVPARQLTAAIAEWRSPSFEEFSERTLWSLENAVTHAIRDVAKTNPVRYASLTMRLQTILAATAAETPYQASA